MTSLSISTLKIKQFLWKYHTLSSLFWAALILLRSKQGKYSPWKVYSPEQNGVFCDCFASFQIAKTFILKLKCSAFIRNTSFTENWKGRLKNWVLVSSVRILVPSGYWATYCPWISWIPPWNFAYFTENLDCRRNMVLVTRNKSSSAMTISLVEKKRFRARQTNRAG